MGIMVLLLASWAGAGPAVEVRGSVHLPEGYEPSKIRWIRVYLVDDDRHRVSLRVRGDLRFEFGGQPGHRYRVYLHSIRFLDGTRLRLRNTDFRVEPETYVVPPVGPVPELRIRARRPRGEHDLRIDVKTRRNLPVPGARVRLARLGRDNRAWVLYGDAVSDVRGMIRFTALPAGRYALDLRSTGSFARTRRVRRSASELVLAGGRSETVAFLLEDAGALQVRADLDAGPAPPVVTVWSVDGSQVIARAAEPNVPGELPVYRFDRLPPARYRVIALQPDGATHMREATVESGKVTVCRISVERPKHARFEPILRWETMPHGLRFAQFFVTSLEGTGATTTLRATRGRPIRRTYGEPLADGPVLLRFPTMRLARLLELDSGRGWQIDVTPPRARLLTRGRAPVTVRVTRRGVPLKDLFCGLRSLAVQPEWMRYAAVGEKGALFQAVADGRYEIVLVDRVLGVDHGIGTRRRIVEVQGGKALQVEWQLPDDAR